MRLEVACQKIQQQNLRPSTYVRRPNDAFIFNRSDSFQTNSNEKLHRFCNQSITVVETG